MESLVVYIHVLERSTLPDDATHTLLADENEVIPVIHTLASQTLLGPDKALLFDEVDKLLTNHGYSVVPRELGQAHIQTKKGIIVFG